MSNERDAEPSRGLDERTRELAAVVERLGDDGEEADEGDEALADRVSAAERPGHADSSPGDHR